VAKHKQVRKRQPKLSTLLKHKRYSIPILAIFVAFLILAGYILLKPRAATVGDPNEFCFNIDWCLHNWKSDGTPDPCTRTEALARLDDMKSIGVKWVRMDYVWPSVQNCGNPATNPACADYHNWNFAPWDDRIREAHRRGLQVLVDMPYYPDWVTGMTMQQRADAYGNYVNGVARHFKEKANVSESQGGILGDVKAFELGNEEDLGFTYAKGGGHMIPATDYPEQVARKEKVAWSKLKAIDNTYNVISGFSGNACPTNYSADVPCGNGLDWDGVNFLRKFYAKVAQLGYNTDQMYDTMAYHAYCWDHNPAIGTATGVCPWNEMVGAGSVRTPYSQWTIRGLMDAHTGNNEPNKKIWTTEIGFAWFYDGNTARDQQRQADSVTYAYNYIQQHLSDYGPMFWYSYKSWPGTASGDEQWGIYNGNDEKVRGTALPAYYAYKNAAKSVVATDNPPTNVAIASHTQFQVINGTVTLGASANDDHGINKVEFFRGNTSIGIATAGIGYDLNWNTASVADGTYDFTVKATDTAGQTTTSSKVSLIIRNNPDTVKPTATIVVPTAGTKVVGKAFTFDATATDNVGVTKVEYYLNGTLIGVATPTQVGWTLNWDSTLKPDGTYNLTAKAYDAMNPANTGTSAAVSINIDNVANKIGDINSDGSVNVTDLSIIGTNYNQSGRTYGQGDISGDGAVNVVDLSILAGHWGS
jgi:hypothetical protein